MEATGTDIRALPAIGLVVETSCRFLASLSFPEPVEAGLRLEKPRRSSVVYEIGLFGAAADPAALGRFVHVYVDAATRRPTPFPASSAPPWLSSPDPPARRGHATTGPVVVPEG